MHKTITIFLAGTVLMIPACAGAQEKTNATDSVPETKEVKNRNVMLNASSDNQPRQISIGLPENKSATIYEDGLPVSYSMWPCLPYQYWKATTQHSSVGVMSLGESAITNGEVNYAVLSKTREGSEKLEGHANYTTNIFNLQRLDLSIASPIAKGWSFSIGAYANLDPGSNRLADVQYANDMKIIKAAVTKRWHDGRGKFNLFYRYSYSKSPSDTYGPFVYVGDGSVKEYNGFRLGHDGFLPANGQMQYIDVMTGAKTDFQRKDASHYLNNSVIANFDYTFLNGINLNVTSKYSYANAHHMILSLAGTGQATTDNGYTYAYDYQGHKAGETFTGYYNSRYMLHDVGFQRSWLTTAELKGKSHNQAHNWRIGANLWWDRQGIEASTGVYAHTVEADPVWLLHNGSQEFDANTGGEYYNTHETKFALFLSDDWQVNRRLWLSAGVRAEYYSIGGQNAYAFAQANDHTATFAENQRTTNWNVTQGTRTRFSKHWINPPLPSTGDTLSQKDSVYWQNTSTLCNIPNQKISQARTCRCSMPFRSTSDGPVYFGTHHGCNWSRRCRSSSRAITKAVPSLPTPTTHLTWQPFPSPTMYRLSDGRRTLCSPLSRVSVSMVCSPCRIPNTRDSA